MQINEVTKERFEQEVWDAETVAQYLGVCKSMVYEMCRRNEIPHKKLPGRRIIFYRDRLKGWLSDDEMTGFRYLFSKIGISIDGRTPEEIYAVVDIIVDAAKREIAVLEKHQPLLKLVR